MSDNLDKKTPEQAWRHFREHGKESACDLSSNNVIEDKPDWFDESRWLRAKESMLKYHLGVSFSSFTGLLLILQLPEGLEPLLVTGNSKDIPSLYKRYLSTVLHVRSWYEEDIFDPSSKSYRSIRQVRAMHKRVSSIMNERFKVPDMDGNPRHWYNHYDVAMTQFAFIGLATLYPEKSGLISATHEEMEDINYCWRVLGYMMGVKDEFNACQFDKYEDIREFNKLIFQHEYLDNFEKLPCKQGLEMTKAICIAMEYFVPLVTFNSLAYWWKDCFKFNGYEPQPLTFKERVLNYVNRISFYHLLKYERFLRLSTKLQKKRFDQRLKNKDKVYEELSKKYKDATEYQFHSDRVDYFVKNAKNETILVGEAINNVKVESDSNNNKDKVIMAGCPFGYEAVLPPMVETKEIMA